MDASTLATAVVQMISGVATSVAQRIGNQAIQGTAEQIYDVVRNWAADSELRRVALGRFEEQPDEPARQEVLRSVLKDAINSDPAFAQQLQEATAGYLTAQGSTVGRDQENVNVNTISKVRGHNQISIGPMTITNSRQARISLTTIAVVLLLITSFGIYGAVQTFDRGTGSPQPGREPTEGNLGPNVAPVVNPPGRDDAWRKYKTTQQAIDLELTEPSGVKRQSHLSVTVQFGVANTDYSQCNFSPASGTTVIPFTVSVTNRAPSTAEYDNPMATISSLNGAAAYIASSSGSISTCTLATAFISPFLNALGPQQQKSFYFELAGAPKDSLSSSGVTLHFYLGDQGDYRWDYLPASAKSVVVATVQ